MVGAGCVHVALRRVELRVRGEFTYRLEVRAHTNQRRQEVVTQRVVAALTKPMAALEQVQLGPYRLAGQGTPFWFRTTRAPGSFPRRAAGRTRPSWVPIGMTRSCPDFGATGSFSESALRTVMMPRPVQSLPLFAGIDSGSK